MRILLSLIICLFLVTACEASEPNPVGLLHPLTIETQDGAHHQFMVEIRRTETGKALGLMYRKDMPDNHGMLFLYPKPRNLSFWMQNTYLPLDLIFIDQNGYIVNIHKNAIPHDTTPIRSKSLATTVLEINAGLAEEAGIRAGDRVVW